MRTTAVRQFTTGMKKPLLLLAALVATSAFSVLMAWREMSKLPLSCMVDANAVGCADFAPWIWTGLISGVAAGVLALTVLAIAWKRATRAGRSKLEIWFLCFVLAAAAVSLFYVYRPQNLGPNTGSPGSGSRFSTGSEAAGSAPAAPVTDNDPVNGVTPRHPFPEVPVTRAGMALETDPFIAQSVEEQSWLDRNGYPNEKLWAVLSQATNAQLSEAAAAGDRAAAALLDQRRLMAGDEDAIGSMLEAGAGGNLFALNLLSSTLARKPQDRVMAYAISRTMEMRGDLRASIARDMAFPQMLTQSEVLEANVEALRLYENLLRVQRETKGPGSPAVDPRPLGR